ncbi:MAG: mechanosensitive ion channel family protein [Oceanicoccus sp.]
MLSLSWLIPELSNIEWLAHAAIFAINIILFIFARPLLNIVESGKESESDARITILRSLNLLVLVLQAINIIMIGADSDYENYFIKAGLTLMAIYAGLLAYSISSYFLRKKFGTEKEFDDHIVFIETYSSRLVDLMLLVFSVIATIYFMIIIWGANSLLETTGIFGIIAAFLAFTSNIWAPDIISGLIILNTQMLEDGDVVVIDGYNDEYVINKVTFVYVILYDIRNNHRTLIRNSRFIQSKIDNLSRIASTEGIRKKLVYQIGYPDTNKATGEEREEALNQFNQKIGKVFAKAFEACCENEQIKINGNKEFEWALTNTGNYALEYTVWIYLERIPNTKVTSTIRKHLMRTMHRVNEAVFTAAVIENIDLSTPDRSNIKIMP